MILKAARPSCSDGALAAAPIADSPARDSGESEYLGITEARCDQCNNEVYLTLRMQFEEEVVGGFALCCCLAPDGDEPSDWPVDSSSRGRGENWSDAPALGAGGLSPWGFESLRPHSCCAFEAPVMGSSMREHMFAPGSDGSRHRSVPSRRPQGSELAVIRSVSKTENPGSNPGSPA